MYGSTGDGMRKEDDSTNPLTAYARSKIGTEQAHNLVAILKEHPTLKSLCGNMGNETELNMSGKGIGPVGAIMLAPEIVANGALVKLVLKDNRLAQKEAGKALGEMLASNTSLKVLDLSDNYGVGARDGPGFAQELAVGLRANGALASLDLSQNGIRAEEMGPIERLCESKQIALRK